MTNFTSFTTFFFLLNLSCLISHCLSRPITLNSDSDSSTGKLKFGEGYWFDHPWLLAHPPLSSNWPKKPWPSTDHPWLLAHPPMPHKWPGMPEKQWPPKDWPFAQSPKPDGWKWWPNKGYGDEEVAADEIHEAAAVADPPLTA